MKIYAIYKGDTFIAEGNVIELAKQLKIAPTTIYFYASSAQQNRAKGKTKYGREKNRKIAIRVDDEDE